MNDAANTALAGAHGRRAPSVSVLIPVWNAERTIERAIRSVLEARTVALECVVIDDGSTDATGAVVERIRREDARVVPIASSTNEGVSEALNRGLDVARGEWLTFLGADDRLLPGGLATMLATARADGALVVVGQRVWSDGRRLWVSAFYDNPDIRRPGRKSLASAPGLLYYASATGKLFHRSVTDGLRYYGRVLGDQPWAIRAMLRAGERLVVIPDTAYEWTRLPSVAGHGSITSATRASVPGGLEAVAVAGSAFRDVRDEALRLLPPERAEVVAGHYAERLLRSDLGMHLLYALGRNDPATGSLLSAIGEFVRSVPPEALRGSSALAGIIEQPLRRWGRLGPDTRAAYWSLLGTARAADPALARREPDPIASLALALLGPGPDGPRRVGATALLRMSSAVHRFVARVRRRGRQAMAVIGRGTSSA